MFDLSVFLSRHFTTLILLFGLVLILLIRRKSLYHNLNHLWLTVISVAVLVAQDVLETWAAEEPSRVFLRTLFSAMGYVLRPVAALGVCMVISDKMVKPVILAIPSFVNTAVQVLAFFTDKVFYFDENYGFVRGPLGYVVFAVSGLYLAIILVFTIIKYGKRFTWESIAIYYCAISCLLSSIIDAVSGGVHLNEAIMTSSVFYYIFLRSQDTSRDQLTQLRNRPTFYEDCNSYGDSINAVAMLDMNGLKSLNDVKGHDAGDKALAAIGRTILAAETSSLIPYRMGGDEFVIMFRKTGEDDISESLNGIVKKVEKQGYSISFGYAVREPGETIQQAYLRADRKMFENKAEHYRSAGIERRRH